MNTGNGVDSSVPRLDKAIATSGNRCIHVFHVGGSAAKRNFGEGRTTKVECWMGTYPEADGIAREGASRRTRDSRLAARSWIE